MSDDHKSSEDLHKEADRSREHTADLEEAEKKAKEAEEARQKAKESEQAE